MSDETNEVKEEKADKKESKSAGKEVQKLVDEIKKLKLTSLPMMAAGAAPAAAGEPVEEKTSFNVELTSAGDNKIGVIKAIREVVPELGLKEAKDLADGAPKMVKENVKKG